MKKLAIFAALVAVALAAKPAEACGRVAGPCPPILQAIGYTFAAGAIGLYGYGTGYFIYNDLASDDHTMGYGGAELALHGSLGLIFGGVALESWRSDKPGQALVLSGFAAMHTTLAVNGVRTMYRERVHYDTDLPKVELAWVAGTAYAVNTLIWTSQLGKRRGRGYGIAEAAVNGPLALGLGYLAVDRLRDFRGGSGLMFGAMAGVSGALAYHGMRTAIDPPGSRGIDLLGTDIVPTVVDDGIELAPGLGTSGTF